MRTITRSLATGWVIIGCSIASCSRTGLLTEPETVGCTEGTLELTRAYPTVLFVLDRSRSMSNSMEETDGASRWQALGTALADSLPNIDSRVQVGGLLFPEAGSEAQCSVASNVDLKPALGNVAKLVTLIEQSSPEGATPTADAIDRAGKTLLSIRASTTARALVLATDGGPDCNGDLNPNSCRCVSDGECRSATRCLDDERTIERIAQYENLGLPTYVVGIESTGDSTFSDVLEAMAVAGGRAQRGGTQGYYAARSEAELGLALGTISEQVGTCVFLTASVPDQGGTIQLYLDGTPLSDTAWTWQERDNGEIVLSAEICDQILAEEAPEITARVTCAES